MIHLFDPENRFWQLLSKIADVFILSFLWFILSLPLVTMGAATAAFYDFTMRQAQNIEGSALRYYFRGFRKNWKRGTVLFLGLLAGTAFFAADLLGVWNFFLNEGGVLSILLLGVVGCLSLAFLGSSFYLYPLLVVYDLPWKELILNGLFLAIGSLHVTVTLVVALLAVAAGIFYLSGLFFIWIGLFIFVSSWLIYGVLLRCPWLREEVEHDPGEDGPSDAAPQGDEMWLV